MGLIKSIQWDAMCDLCNNYEKNEVEFWSFSKKDFHTMLKNDGWRVLTDGTLYCPNCKSKDIEEKIFMGGKY